MHNHFTTPILVFPQSNFTHTALWQENHDYCCLMLAFVNWTVYFYKKNVCYGVWTCSISNNMFHLKQLLYKITLIVGKKHN